MEVQKYLPRKAASDYLDEKHGVKRAPSTLAKLAVIGGGPTFRRINRIPLYATDDLDKWVVSKLSAPMRSTSDTASEITGDGKRDTPRGARNGDLTRERLS
jgi:hypothetical protein